MALICSILLFLGLSFDPATTNTPSSSRIFPKNCTGQTMVQPDGQVRFMAYDFSRPGVLLGKKPWVGQITKRRTDVWADPSMTGGKRRTAYTFLDGRLRQLYLDGKIYNFPKGRPQIEGELQDLWPKKSERSMQKGSSGDIWQKSGRLRLWYANPNCTGFLFAELALIALSFLFLAKSWWRVIPLVCLLASSWGMVLTGSRGAMLSFIFAAVLMALFSVKKIFTKKNLLIAGAVLLVGAGLLVAGGAVERFTSLAARPDAGNMLRIKIADASAKMFVDAPWGWRGGEVPGRTACLNWYVLDEDHVIRTHLLYLAENGWVGGFLYIAFWLFAIFLSVPSARKKRPLSLGLWAAFLAAGFLNPVQGDITLWILPAMILVLTLWRKEFRPSRLDYVKGGAVVVVVSLLSVISFAVIGNMADRTGKLPVKASGKAVEIWGADPKVWIVEDMIVLGGWGFPGREILAASRNMDKKPAIGYAHSLNDLPSSVERLVLPGEAAAEYLSAYRQDPSKVCKANEIVFLSPSVGPDLVPEELLKASKVKWYVGYFAALRDKSYKERRPWVKILSGIELYIPNWFSLACVQAL